MTAPIGGAAGVASPDESSQDKKLRQTSKQLEGVFVQKMFAAMRETVPQDGVIQQSNAEGMFSDMFDSKIADAVPQQWSGSHSLADAIYRQLRHQMDTKHTTTDGSRAGSPTT